jgi:hypothetical protein
MLKIEDIQAEIETLPEKEYTRLRVWFFQRDWKKWDREIQEDSTAGRLDFLCEETLREKKRGELEEL